MRWLIPQPCMGSSDTALRMSRSRVPCRTSALGCTGRLSLTFDRKVGPFLSNVKERVLSSESSAFNPSMQSSVAVVSSLTTDNANRRLGWEAHDSELKTEDCG